MTHQYYHVFFTRLAINMAVMSNGKLAARSQKHIDRIVRFWFKFGCKFLHSQTIDRGFEVRMIYSPRYKDVIRSYTFPDFVKFYKYAGDPMQQSWRNLDDVPRPCLVHRIDADDQYSQDFFAYSEIRANTKYQEHHDAMLHTKFIQYDVRKQLTSPGIHTKAPHFVTVRLLPGESLQMPKDPLHTKQHNVPRLYKTFSSGNVVLALEAVHGRNIVNRWFGSHKGVLLPHKRFVYFGDQVAEPTAIGSEPRKSSNK